MPDQPNRGPVFTWALIFGTIAIWIIYDVFAALHFGTASTISWQTYEWSQKYPFIAFAAGVLCGHLFAEMRGTAP
jgi:hypothetical protein